MSRPWRISYSGARYHVTARGNGRQQIFFGEEDYERFLEQLVLALEKDGVILYAYCLMPNHYHLFVETPLGNIQRFEQRLNTAYGMYYRYKHRRPGHCFQGRYGGKLVDGADYILRLTRYIHLNPVETERMKKKTPAEQKAYLHNYRWSSFPGYVRRSSCMECVDYQWLELMERATALGNRRAYRAYAEGMIGKDDEVLKEAFYASRYAIGGKKFVEQAESELNEMHIRRASFGDITLPRKDGVQVEKIEKVVAARYGIDLKDLHDHGRRVGEAKGVAIELCCMLSGKNQRQIARHFGYKTDAGISRQRRILREKAKVDPAIQKQLKRLAKRLSK